MNLVNGGMEKHEGKCRKDRRSSTQIHYEPYKVW